MFKFFPFNRIDSSKYYIKGNVQWVCKGINFMKNNFSMEDTFEFLKLLKEYL